MPHSRSAFWKIALLISLNALLIPFTIPVVVYQQDRRFQYFLLQFWGALTGAYDGQLFLLGLWMTFGGKWRHITATALGFVGFCSVCTICMAPQMRLMEYRDFPLLFPTIFGPPCLCAAIIWINQDLLLPGKWWFGVTAHFGHEPQRTETEITRRYGILDVIIATIFVAIPCAFIRLYSQIERPDQLTNWHIQVFIPAIIFVSAIPICLALLAQRLRPIWILASVIWCGLTMLLDFYLPAGWGSFDNILMHSGGLAIVIANLLLMRRLGVRWTCNRLMSEANLDSGSKAKSQPLPGQGFVA